MGSFDCQSNMGSANRRRLYFWFRLAKEYTRNRKSQYRCYLRPSNVLRHIFSFFSKFILLDQMAMMALTKWTVEKRIPVPATANLIFNKDTFLSITPYGQNQHIYSGDDVFLLQSFLSNRGRVIYLQDENSIVRTHSRNLF